MATGTLKALHFRVPVADGGALRQLNPSFRNGTVAWRDVSHLGSISSSSLGFPPNCWIIRATEGPNQQVECKDNRSRGLAGLSDSVDTITTQSKSSLDFAVISFLPQESVLPVSNKKKNVNEKEEQHDVKVDGGFVVPDSNAFGHSFRDYEKESERNAQVAQFYKTNHINQTYEFATKKKQEYGKLQKGEMSIWECCELLNEFVDESDPDLDEPQIEHLLQTAEAIRKDYPDQDWLHLTALIHDLGKVLLHPTFGGEPQWCAVGDTFPLGCAFDESIVHHQYFKESPDYQNPVYRTKLGVYKENCGLDKVTMSWGHDEYMYLVAKGNNTTLPPAALFIIRFHSFYPLHRSGAYSYLMNDEDKEMLKWLQIFNKYDLYTKSKVRVNQEEVKPYYLSLIQKYFPAKLRW